MLNSMKKSIITISFLVLMILFASSVSASAETKAGIKPSSFFYFFDTAFEKINLFLNFNPQKKAEKALEYANERLAEAEAVAQEKNTDAVKTAVAGYESNIASAAEESNQIKDKNKTEELLNLIADNTSKHQEILADVLSKVPEEAKEAITKAIEASRKGQEEVMKQIVELKGEVEQLKQEVAELKTQNEEQEKTIGEVGKQKPEIKPKSTPTPTVTKPTASQTSEVKPTPTPVITSSQTPTMTTTTLPNGAVVEMDKNGNIIRTIKEAPTNTTTQIPIAQGILSPTPVTSPILSSLSLPKVTVSPGKVDYRNNQSYKEPGGKDYIFAGIKITTDKKIILNSIKWHQSGSASFTGMYDNGNPVYPNVKTYIDGIAYGISFSADGKYIISELGGIIISPGEAKDIYLRGDLAEIVCISKDGCPTDNGLMCKLKETCPECKDDGSGRCQYPYQKIDVDIYNPKDISIFDEKGNVIVPQAEQLWNYENSGGFRSGTPWYDGYRIEMELQPPRP